ncbi:pyrimidine-nucleoside phosphorylase [Halalkalibacterium halodurans]|uniref:pyrimidine-nucleoside phosphorylase n=1 Tax=Halalkalibacterium halodurans TaxID=86665 RepID=UPI002E24E60F|nr:pyrimidine-nucleoside phosphorylase [Halalkalibacterium halodurans]MED4083081.1 pyrimidine-nucleoside phosphorylase [Halalkalibacterium halodurans]MED4087090.1 pyrimidine-nucleoside phosphorylase [Halalkalibacterium halodurans]MED4106695.1 pyrimidine-nucleoside phosphorylase [Halalkalibacterium halodurans]MED4109793.1 pyrimidine-nucleoside phosphorylase [Halalkalibacterium halodurans]MED4151099.1 pyrimidine-nucleoside phosphorylase [Halalkalibacterium halodurans]
MRMVDLIEKKRDGLALTKEEIDFIISGYTNGDIPDYQMSAFAMAIFFQDMTADERAYLTMAMAESGDQIDLSGIEGVKVDKHSTGGVGDKTTIALAPLVASVGVPVAKMSGRGLGHTGGTIDKLESIAGFNVEIPTERFLELVNKNKLAVVGQTANLTPADKKLYGLRDVTATVNSIPLIASSIMSKKIASGANAIVLDVKTGSGAFMKELEQSKELAEAMVEIGNNLGRQTMAVISDMNQPLGWAVGNALEVKEAIDMLRGEGPDDLRELCLTLGSHMVFLAKQATSVADARQKLEEAISSGKALDTLKTFISAQNGDPSVVDNPQLLPTAQFQIEVKAEENGHVASIVADRIGTAAMVLGAGRATKVSDIDLSVGIVLKKKMGESVQAGETLAILHANKEDVQEVIDRVIKAYHISPDPVAKPTLIYEEIH